MHPQAKNKKIHGWHHLGNPGLKNFYITNTVPSFYLVGDIYFTVLHARLRNNCSNLNNDLYVNHLRADPLCNCLNENEDANHFQVRQLYKSARNPVSNYKKLPSTKFR